MREKFLRNSKFLSMETVVRRRACGPDGQTREGPPQHGYPQAQVAPMVCKPSFSRLPKSPHPSPRPGLNECAPFGLALPPRHQISPDDAPTGDHRIMMMMMMVMTGQRCT